MSSDKNNIFYHPYLSPIRIYMSNATFQKVKEEQQTYLPDVNPDDDRVKKAVNDMIELQEVLKNTPAIRHLAPVVDKLIQRLKIAFPGGWYTPPLEIKPLTTPDKLIPPKYTYTPPSPPIFTHTVNPEYNPEYNPGYVEYQGNEELNKTDEESEDTVNPTTDRTVISITNKDEEEIGSVVFPEPSGISVSIIEPGSTVNIAIKAYADDTINLQEYYINSMRNILQHYYNQMLTTSLEGKLGDYTQLLKDIDASQLNIPNQNLVHLKDYIARSQTLRKQKVNFFKKTHNADQTVIAMRRWHAAEKERERYYNESYSDSSDFLGHESNELLRKSRQQYDSQYKDSMYNMYKYLNSSISMADDVLEMSANEAKAKAKLMNEGVDVLSTIIPEEMNNVLPENEVTVTDFGGAESIKNNPPGSSSNSNSSGTISTGGAGSGSANSQLIEKALQWCINIANDNSTSHLYSQADRNGPNYDCTSFISHGLMNAGLNLPYAFGGDSFNSDLCQYGFEELNYPGESGLQRGDILSNSQHVAFYLGGGQMVHARNSGVPADEQIAVTDFYDDWNTILRYKG